jgi:hypothetical protein
MNTRMIKSSLSIILLSSATSLLAQSLPAPAQFATAKKIFLGSGGAPGTGFNERLFSSQIYTTMYQSLQASGRYQMQTAPSDAELGMTISVIRFSSSVTNGNSGDITSLRLEITDIKTRTLLWAIDEPLQGAFREKTFEKNVGSSISAMMADLNALAAGQIPGSAAANITDTSAPEIHKADPCKAALETKEPKTRLSQEPKP